MSKKRNTINSFKYAFDGIKTALINEPNFRIHAIASIFAMTLGFYFQISKNDWMILVLTISSVVILELINTSIEAIVDLISPKINPLAKIAKDVSAAAVLISSASAIIIGALIFLPFILKLF